MKHQVVLPNIRKLFIPDPGFTIFDADLAGADAQVVAAEADDQDLRAAFAAGLDVHDKNATDLWGHSYTSLAGDSKNGPKSRRRKECKQGVHLTNYGGSARACAIVLGWTTHEAEQFQRRWFTLHPGIKKNFQERIEAEIRSTRTIYNRFGYRRVYFDRIDSCYTQALAWVPQSTVAEVSFRGALQLEERWSAVYPHHTMYQLDARSAANASMDAERYMERFTDRVSALTGMLLQVHDSLVFQIPSLLAQEPEVIRFIKKALEVPIPYPEPLTIQWGIARSNKSWGECEGVQMS